MSTGVAEDHDNGGGGAGPALAKIRAPSLFANGVEV